jgi:hypothetical protein
MREHIPRKQSRPNGVFGEQVKDIVRAIRTFSSSRSCAGCSLPRKCSATATKVEGQAHRDQQVGCDCEGETDVLDRLNGVEEIDIVDLGSMRTIDSTGTWTQGKTYWCTP